MNNWKKSLSLLLTLAMLLGLGGTALADEVTGLEDENVTVTIDGEEVELADADGNSVAPVIIDGSTYLPIRAVAEALGLDVDWDRVNREVQLKKKAAPEIEHPWEDDIPAGETFTTRADESLTAYNAEMELFDKRTYKNSDEAIGDMTYYVYDPTAHGFPADQTYPVALWLHGGGNGSMGRLAIAAGGAAGMASEKHQQELGGMYIICPLANETTAGSWPRAEYNASLKGILDEVKATHPAANDILLMAGTSAGGMGVCRFAEDYHDMINGIFWMSTTIPSPETVQQYSDEGIKMWFELSLHDETGAYENNFTENTPEDYTSIENFELTLFDWIRWGDKTIASLNVGMEQGQHCSCAQVNRNLIFDDGTPDDPNHPNGVTGWFRSVIDGAAA